MKTKLFFVLVSICLKWSTTEDLKHHLVADENGMYHLFWSVDGEDITFEVQVATKGYVGFGLSLNGSMAGSDIVIGWVLPNGRTYFHDRHALGYYEPLIDTEQNYNLINAYENETHTVLRFTRKLNTCDKENDTVITDSTMKLIYSWHPDDPNTIESIQYHGPYHRGAKNNFFLSPPIPPVEITDDITIWDIQFPNVTIPPQTTSHICFYTNSPPVKKPYYYLGFTMELSPEIEKLLHHIAVYECSGTYNEEEYGQKTNVYDCEMKKHFVGKRNCTLLLFWGKGGNWQFFPKGVGRKLNGPYFVVRLHYTNFDMTQGIVDRTKVKAYLSNDESTTEIGKISMNASVDYSLFIPPQQPALKVTTYCPSEFTSVSFPKEGINVFGAFGHSHVLGRKFSLRHYRDNKELKPIFEDMNDDFEYQEVRILPELVKIMPGDMLMGTCVYSSMEQNETVLGGEASTEEMCIFVLWYYPIVNLTMCTWEPNYEDIFHHFGVNEVAEDKVHIISPSELQNQTVIDVITHYNWTTVDEAKMKRLTSVLYDGQKNISCSTDFRGTETNIVIPVSYPIDISPYIPTTGACENTSNAINTHVLDN